MDHRDAPKINDQINNVRNEKSSPKSNRENEPQRRGGVHGSKAVRSREGVE